MRVPTGCPRPPDRGRCTAIGAGRRRAARGLHRGAQPRRVVHVGGYSGGEAPRGSWYEPRMVVRSRAPLRLSFAGGGTDVAPFPETEGGAVLSATIDRYAYGSLTPRADQRICVHSLDLGMSLDFDAGAEPSFDGRLDLVKAAIRRLGGDSSGFDLLLRSSAPPGSGLGSSSTMLV